MQQRCVETRLLGPRGVVTFMFYFVTFMGTGTDPKLFIFVLGSVGRTFGILESFDLWNLLKSFEIFCNACRPYTVNVTGATGLDCGQLDCMPNGNPCHGKGECRAGKCICEPPFVGKWCESKVCPVGRGQLECSGDGMCGDDGASLCNDCC